MNTHTQERDRRILLSTAIEPGDAVTAALVNSLGTEATLRAAHGEPLPELATWPAASLTAWREQIAPRLHEANVDRVLDACARGELRILVPGDEDWPTGIDDLAAVPLVLYARGDASLLARPLIAKAAIVGTTSGTGYGDFLTQQTVADLAAEGFTIVSGASVGIEAAAQRAALAAGGASIAVLAGGVDRRCPDEHQRLIDAIADTGAVVSELPPSAEPSRWRFLQRGRIIAATSAATVVVEATRSSSALHIAAHARNLGRPLAAYPGSASSTASEGTHELIAHGTARLVTSGTDVRDLIDPDPRAGFEPGRGPEPSSRTLSRRAALVDFSAPSSTPTLGRSVPGPAL